MIIKKHENSYKSLALIMTCTDVTVSLVFEFWPFHLGDGSPEQIRREDIVCAQIVFAGPFYCGLLRLFNFDIDTSFGK